MATAPIDYTKLKAFTNVPAPEFAKFMFDATGAANPNGQANYDTAVSQYNKWSLDPAAVDYRVNDYQTKYAPVVDAQGKPLFDPTFYGGLATGTVDPKVIDTQLNSWADNVLKNDPSINWALTGGAVDKNLTYAAAKKNLLSNLSENLNYKNYQQSVQTAADKVAADKIAADKVAADKVAADKVAADKAAVGTTGTTGTTTAGQTKTIDDTLSSMYSPLDKTKLQGGFDANGKPIIVSAPITQGMIDTAKQNVTTTASDINKLTDAAKASEVNVTPDSMVSNQLSGLLAKNNPYIQQAVNAANLQASRRGMLNTGAAAGFATDAAIKQALPIAQQDALTRQKANEANALATNTLQRDVLNLKSNALLSDAVETNKVANIYTQAQLTDLINGAQNASKLNELVTSGNIAAYNQATKGAIDESLNIINATLKDNNAKFQANLDYMLKAQELIGAEESDFRKYVNERQKSLETANNAIDVQGDLTATAKSTLKNNNTSLMLSEVTGYLSGTSMYKSISSSDAGKIASELVNFNYSA